MFVNSNANVDNEAEIKVVANENDHEEEFINLQQVMQELNTNENARNNYQYRFSIFLFCINLNYNVYFVQSKPHFREVTLSLSHKKFAMVDPPEDVMASFQPLWISGPNMKTLVIDVVGILVQSFDGTTLVLRPHALSFIKSMQPFYELVAMSNIS